MIMRPGSEQLLLPANPLFVVMSLVLALVFTLVPLGRMAAMPDVLAVVLVFWGVHQPRRIGVVWAFILGLLVDVHHGALLGQHALAYSILGYGAASLQRRVLWFELQRQQVMQILPLFVVSHLVALLVRLLVGGMWPGWWSLLAPVLEAALWPLATWALLAPQRRPPDPDAHRPL